jgi:F-type H+-transporting ATPase subunit b
MKRLKLSIMQKIQQNLIKPKLAVEAAEEARRAKQRANEEIEQSKKEAISGIKGNVADISVKIAEN